MIPSSTPRPAVDTCTHAHRHARVLAACSALTALTALTALAACATGRSGYSTYDVAPLRAPVHAPVRAAALASSSLRTLDALALRRMPYVFLLDAVHAYWPGVGEAPFSTTSLARSEPDPIGVYENGLFVGGLEALRDVRVSEVARVRRLTASEESLQFGRQHRAGAIAVERVRAPASGALR